VPLYRASPTGGIRSACRHGWLKFIRFIAVQRFRSYPALSGAARRFILNPVLVIISVVFWYWMWGVAGALLAVPMLAALKIICDRILPLAAFGHFLGAGARN
jgi:AI-2E family transporter